MSLGAPHSSAEIRAQAQTFGFDAVGITGAQADGRDRRNLAQYIAEGRHGDMEWMGRDIDRRADPQTLWPEARSIVCVGINYGPAVAPLSVHEEPERGAISVYARGRDYHEVLKKRLKAFGRWIAATYACEVKIFVDTAPAMEKPLAMRAGVGWIGKHTNLVSRRFGSWLFLGEIFTTLDLAPDPPEVDHCGSCDACVRACPTDALREPYRIEPRRCIAYLTVEHKGAVPPGLAKLLGNRIFGCDDCLAACPWNKFATPTPHAELQPRAALMAPRLLELAQLDEARFKALFAGTPIRRTGHQRMMRNVRIAADNQQISPPAKRIDPGTSGVAKPASRFSGRHRPIRLSLAYGRGRSRQPSPRSPSISPWRTGWSLLTYLAARTRANWLSASRWRSLGIWVKLRASSRHMR